MCSETLRRHGMAARHRGRKAYLASSYQQPETCRTQFLGLGRHSLAASYNQSRRPKFAGDLV